MFGSFPFATLIERKTNADRCFANNWDYHSPNDDLFRLGCAVVRQAIARQEQLLGQRFKPGQGFLLIDLETIWKNRVFESNLKDVCQSMQNRGRVSRLLARGPGNSFNLRADATSVRHDAA